MRLHEDEDFQQDANDPSIEPALDIMRADPRAMEQYEGNARMMRVLHKLRSFQVVVITIKITIFEMMMMLIHHNHDHHNVNNNNNNGNNNNDNNKWERFKTKPEGTNLRSIVL